MFSRSSPRPSQSALAAIAVAIGAYAIVNSSSSNDASGTANAATLARPGQNQRTVGQIPKNWRPGTGTIITGAAANKAKAVALAKYAGGTVNRVLKFSDGSYAVHMIKISCREDDRTLVPPPGRTAQHHEHLAVMRLFL